MAFKAFQIIRRKHTSTAESDWMNEGRKRFFKLFSSLHFVLCEFYA